MKETAMVTAKKKKQPRRKGGSGQPMSFTKARKVIRDDSEDYISWWIASIVLCIDKRSSFEDLLACLKRGSAARWGAKGLHKRTGRRCKHLHWITDLKDWEHYLKAKGYL